MIEHGLVTEEEADEEYGPQPDATYANPNVAVRIYRTFINRTNVTEKTKGARSVQVRE